MKPYSIPALAAVVLIANAAAARADTVTGRVTDVQPEKKQFSLRLADNQTRLFQMDDKSEIRLRGTVATVKDLKIGTALKVNYEPRGGENHVVAATQETMSTAELRKQVRDTLAAAREYTFQNKDQYLARLQALLNSMDDQIDDLRQQARTASGEAKQELNREIAALEKKRDELRARMPEIKKSSAEAWNDLKRGLGEAAEDFQKAWERARSRFKD